MKRKINILLLIISAIIPGFLFAQFTQQGSKLVGTGDDAASFQGASVAISSDGNTAVEGGIYDNSVGAIWVYTRNAGVWTQQGPKLVGTGYLASPYQGYSVAISSDGNTIIEGGYRDNNDIGAAWVFTRTAGVWTQQGSKLVGSGAAASGQINQGTSVAISSDGNTALVGGSGDGGTGAVWVFTRSGGVWTQHGSKLVGTGGVGQQNQGSSLAISGDGNTFVTGGIVDNDYVGAVWVYTRNGSDWVQQGTKLVGSDNDVSQQGFSVAISSDGNTVIIGGPGDFLLEGAIWVFIRSGGVWSQQGLKWYAEVSTSPINVGRGVAVTPDGNTAVVTGPGDSGSLGILWVFTRSAGVWTQQSSTIYGTGAVGAARQGWSVAVSSEGTVIEGGPYDNGGEGASWIFNNPTIGIPVLGNIPEKASLGQNFPNPFSSGTKFTIRVPNATNAKVSVFDETGREVAVLLNQQIDPGTHEVYFDGSNIAGGTYYYKLVTSECVEMKKMILIK